MRRTLASLALTAALALPASAETLSQEIARTGITPTLDRLIALPLATPEDGLATGMLKFLAAIEGTFQTRWQHGLTDPTGSLPLLRLGVPDNPAATFDPAAITTMFRNADRDLAIAQKFLAAVGDSDVTLTIDLADLWFDVNGNAARDPGEDLLLIAADLLGTPASTTIRFDAADAAWASAYCHLLMGISRSVLAYDPTGPITEATAALAAMAALGPMAPDPIFGSTTGTLSAVDLAALVIKTLDQTPDPSLAAAAQASFLAMIAENRRFWTLVAAETDNVSEWLPNDAQQSALGLTLPPGTGPTWLAVLSDAEALLQGRLLVPYWRMGDGVGVNIGKMFTDPRPIDLVGWIQGAAALPYLERGPLVSAQSFRAFEGMVGGDSVLMALYLN